MAETNGVHLTHAPEVDTAKYAPFYESYEIHKVCDDIWHRIQAADKYIQDNQPFKTVKVDKKKAEEQIAFLLGEVAHVGILLAPILPSTSEKIAEAIKANKIETALFMRK